MKNPFIASLIALAVVTTTVDAQDFGLEDDNLAQQFYDEAREIVKRSLTPEQKLFYGIENSGGDSNSQTDNGFGILREAYRADPEATLELIRRIMEAGEQK
ncbi:MAG: hypothetical protein ABJF05_22205 [Paracoccaceae bacterium]